MQTFDLLGFAKHLGTLTLAVLHEELAVLEKAAKVIETEAKAEIGTYQNAAGPFVAWAPLAPSTLQGWGGHPGKIALGYAPPDNPLLRIGTLRDSIEHTIVQTLSYSEAHVGSNEDVAVWQELGTSTIPARSFLGGAAFRKAPHVAHMMGHDIATVLMGGRTRLQIT